LSQVEGDSVFAGELVESFIGTGDKTLAAIAASLAAARLEDAVNSGETDGIPRLADGLATKVRSAIEFLRSRVA
jgi:hypothetical protein